MKSTKDLARRLGILRKRSVPKSEQDVAIKRAKKSNQTFSYLIVIDFESTCWKDKKSTMQEIIEFPAVLLNTATGEIESEFHTYVQPQENPKLSAFCKELTGISQEKVDNGMPIHICLSQFTKWLRKLSLEKNISYHSGEDKKLCTFVTWSDWDLGVCLHYETRRKQIRKPAELSSWIDLRATYRNFYERRPNGLNGALQDVGIKFTGREHSGLDDARNTARLAWRMICDGCVMKITKTMNMTSGPGSHRQQSSSDQPVKSNGLSQFMVKKSVTRHGHVTVSNQRLAKDAAVIDNAEQSGTDSTSRVAYPTLPTEEKETLEGDEISSSYVDNCKNLHEETERDHCEGMINTVVRPVTAIDGIQRQAGSDDCRSIVTLKTTLGGTGKVNGNFTAKTSMSRHGNDGTPSNPFSISGIAVSACKLTSPDSFLGGNLQTKNFQSKRKSQISAKIESGSVTRTVVTPQNKCDRAGLRTAVMSRNEFSTPSLCVPIRPQKLSNITNTIHEKSAESLKASETKLSVVRSAESKPASASQAGITPLMKSHQTAFKTPLVPRWQWLYSIADETVSNSPACHQQDTNFRQNYSATMSVWP
ncbi:uncharacterized protein [Ptychodera flava]|uniref:uncharacterized protein n=1 Tax=Ptychodera flava TaxID=63121 RepID=UPI00396A0503